MPKLMLQKHPYFLFPLSHFGSQEEVDEELMPFEWDPSCGFVLELQKNNPFPEKIGAFMHWSELSFDDEIPLEEFDSDF